MPADSLQFLFLRDGSASEQGVVDMSNDSDAPTFQVVQAGIITHGVTLLEEPFTREILSKHVRQVLDEPIQVIRRMQLSI
jgi:hypothetical protein